MTWSWNKNVLKTVGFQSWKHVLNVYKTFSLEPFEGVVKTFWRQGSISKKFKHTVQTSSGRITWGRGEDILQTGVFFNLKNDLWTCSKISTWTNWRRYGGVLKVVFPTGFKTSCKRLHILWLEVKIQTFMETVIFTILNTLSKHLRNISVWAIWRRYEDALKTAFPKVFNTPCKRLQVA